MAERERLARDAERLDRRRLVDGEADRILGRGQSVEAAVGAADGEEGAADDAVGVAVDEVIARVARGDGDGRHRVRERKAFRDERLEGLRHPRHVADHHRAAGDAVEPRPPLDQPQQYRRPPR